MRSFFYSSFQGKFTKTIKGFALDLFIGLHVNLMLVESTSESPGLLWAKVNWLVLLTLKTFHNIRTHERDGLSKFYKCNKKSHHFDIDVHSFKEKSYCKL